ncbi:MAG: DUF4321 domain-containing protein [candidate division WOR-3 bacterium]
MRNRPVYAGGRSIGLLIIALVVAGVAGSVLSHFLSGLFPAGPVRDFFFKSVQFGVPTFILNLGFASITFGLSFAITTFAVILLLLAIYLWYRF